MKKDLQQLLKSQFRKIRLEEPLSKHSTFGVGGKADAYIEVDDLDPISPKSLQAIIKFCKKTPTKPSQTIPFYIVGGGSNILFHDKGFRGLIIKLTANKIDIQKSKKTVKAEAGAILAKLIKETSAKGLDNLAAWTGIPGTVGGAVRGNAGANGLETRDVLLKAEILNTKTGKTTSLNPKKLEMSYRHSNLKDDPTMIVLSATFHLSKLTPEALAKIQEKAKQARATQPPGRTAGSFFKNPDPTERKKLPKNIPLAAGYLIDQCNLKGHKIGGVQISDVHANFFQNRNVKTKPATQKDLLALAKLAKQKVQKKFNITLQEEVQIVPPEL